MQDGAALPTHESFQKRRKMKMILSPIAQPFSKSMCNKKSICNPSKNLLPDTPIRILQRSRPNRLLPKSNPTTLLRSRSQDIIQVRHGRFPQYFSPIINHRQIESEQHISRHKLHGQRRQPLAPAHVFATTPAQIRLVGVELARWIPARCIGVVCLVSKGVGEWVGDECALRDCVAPNGKFGPDILADGCVRLRGSECFAET